MLLLMAAVDELLERALQLPERERGELASRLLRSLESVEDEELAPDAWEAAWSEVLDRRMREVRDGTVQLVDGDAVFRGAAERIASRRP
jgi:Putative addiction module component